MALVFVLASVRMEGNKQQQQIMSKQQPREREKWAKKKNKAKKNGQGRATRVKTMKQRNIY